MIKNVTGRRWVRPVVHPWWCHEQRCAAGYHQLGEHRSLPVTVGCGPRGGIVATRVQTAKGRQVLELVVSVPLPDPDERGRQRRARRALDRLVVALNRVAA